MSKIKLICLPYAGGSSVIFSKWPQYLPSGIELHPVELAGRGTRIYEPLYPDLAAMVEDVFQRIHAHVITGPYAIFGHSMGAVIAYELVQRMAAYELPPPRHAFFSGKGAPGIVRADEKKYHEMGDAEFREELLELGGTPPDFFDHPELLALFLPLLKNDFRLADQENAGCGDIRPLKYDITVLLGKDEDLIPEQCTGWKSHTTGRCSIHYFKGGHFFLNDRAEEVVRLIGNVLQSSIAELPASHLHNHASH